ncbi:MAG: hypothetical protein ABI460_07170 [Caldimonas sp.]
MIRAGVFKGYRGLALAALVVSMATLSSCGGGSTGNIRDSGPDKTFLSVEASDADGDPLQYQWRVTAGSIDNRNSRETVWTMPTGPGIHFAYVTISDGKGGWAEQQYAVSTDGIDPTLPVRTPVTHAAPAVVDIDGSTNRLRFFSADTTRFQPAAAGAPQARTVYLTDVQVQVVDEGTGATVFGGITDLSGELDLPKLANGSSYNVRCTVHSGSPLQDCGSFTATGDATVRSIVPALTSAQNLRLFGHVALADGAVCGHENAFFSIQTAATVQLQLADGTAVGSPVRVNRFGDYEVSAAVPVKGTLKLALQCEGYAATLDVPASSDPAGYLGSVPVELSLVVPNTSPQVVKMVANGADGNVRGRMIVPGQGTGSNAFAGADHYLTYKGGDTKLSACLYYRALGAVGDCDAQGNPSEAISFTDWKTLNGFGIGSDVSANYVNQRDLNLLRRMVATRTPTGGVAFYVCNAPGPDSKAQSEVDQVMKDALENKNLVACVAMEYSTVTGANGGQPFTKFFTFAPDGSLLLSINLDGRGEKYMPGSCVACHGGSTYNGRFPEQQTASPFLGSRFLPFDTGNYLFASDAALSEATQSEAFYQLNQLVLATEVDPASATSQLIAGWYAAGHVLDKAYVAPVWQTADAAPATAGAARFYREVIGISCRTCHVSLGAKFDWDSIILTPARAGTQFCGGTPDVAINATMPNALISRDRLFDQVASDNALAALMTQFLGCSAPLPDPVYAKR